MKSLSIFIIIWIASCIHLFASATNEKINPQQMLLSDNWSIQQSSKVNADGQVISSENFSTSNWYPATVPSTVMGTLTKNGLYAGLLEGTNYKTADRTPFDSSWWYRTEFKISKKEKGQHYSLQFEGLSYRANIWLNGKLIASKDDIYGPFCRFSFDITNLIEDNNILAVEVFRAQWGEPNIGFVDWNPRPLDESMGLFREVKINVTGEVSLKNTRVQSRVNTQSLSEAWLTIETEAENLSDKKISGQLKAEIGSIKFSIPVSLEASEKKIITIKPEDIKDLHIKNPRLWWSVDLGKPELYNLDLNFSVSNQISASENITFGIRQIDTYFTDKGHKGFLLNGKKVLIKGAGWTDDIFLRDTPESNERQVKYVKDMNMNTIRFENIWGTSQNIYDLCDRYGILALIGWSCQWEWKVYLGTPDDEFGCIKSEHDMNLLTRFLNDQVLWLRNHPSIIAWYGGSDKLLHPELEKKYMALLPTIDDRPYVGAAKGLESPVTGKTGMKMVGPYEYVGPDYWFVDSKFGGAFGFNTETGPGPQIPVYESIIKMIPEDKLWPINEVWDYHCTTAPEVLNNLNVLNSAMEGMYGKAENLKDYLRKSHLMNYESTKSMFEAFRVNRTESTGLIQWMLNSAWPSLYWQLYDYYQIPVPAYYGVKTANAPQQLIYNYKDNGIYAVNETLSGVNNLKAVIQGFSFDSKPLYKEEISISLQPDASIKIFEVKNLAKNSFVSLRLYDQNGKLVAENFYSLSSKQNSYAWDKTDWVGTPLNDYADFKDLSKMPTANLNIKISGNSDKNPSVIQVEIENSSATIAHFVDMKLVNDKKEIIYPAYWSDNYVSILPYEKKVYTCKLDNAKYNDIFVCLSGWNINDFKGKINK